ncbi:MAG TPA: SOS response-associated peptidase [Haloplasmataceae bacterium]
MCGRIRFTLNKDDFIQILHDRYAINDYTLDYSIPKYNIAPSNDVIAVINDGSKYRIGLLRWGFVPTWAKDNKFMSINAKAETILEKKMFALAFNKRRCVILADGFYEWKKVSSTKIPYNITIKDQEIMPLAGLYNPYINEKGEKIFTCTIITTTPNEILSSIHERMPVILTKDNEKIWLNPHINTNLLQSVLEPYSSHNMDFYTVSNIVNNPLVDTPDCIKPYEYN